MSVLIHEGMRVPWVTRWSAEMCRDPFTVMSDSPEPVNLRLGYPDGKDKREAGFLWAREYEAQGQGEPQFSQVSTNRQLRSMTERLCQVCGNPIPRDKPIRWLMVEAQLENTPGGVLTISPPTCEGCVPIAIRLCPAMNRLDYVVLVVKSYEPWGVMGDRYELIDGAMRGHKMATVQTGSPAAPLTLAKQMTVLITDFGIEKP